MDIVRGQTQEVSRSLVSPFWVSVPVITYTICALAIVQPTQAAIFNIRSGDVPALINAMETAQSNGEDNTINLEAGNYILTAAADSFHGENGLPTITGNITINGAGAESTVIARAAGTTKFRIFHVGDEIEDAVVTFNGLTITGGTSELFGGGIANFSATVLLTNSTVSGNTAAAGPGGGIVNFGRELRIRNSTISGNTSDTDGGGGIANFGPTLTIINSTISGNTSGEGSDGGGGIYNSPGFFGAPSSVPNNTVIIINSTIVGNKADNTMRGGGGLLNISPGTSTVTIINSTIARNRAVTMIGLGGGGILNNGVGSGGGPGTVTIKNTIVAQNVGTGGVGSPNTTDCGGKISNAGHNISNGISCGFGEGDNLDPLLDILGPLGLQDNGGPTQTIALLPGSPAINAIPPLDCTDLDGQPITTDQRGFRRPFGAACDIGAFEFGVARVNDLVALSPPSTFLNPTPVPGGPAGTFAVTVIFTNTSSNSILNPFFQVIELSGGNLLLNADGGAGGVGATLTPGVGSDAILSAGESFTVDFVIGLQARTPFTFLVNLIGVPSP